MGVVNRSGGTGSDSQGQWIKTQQLSMIWFFVNSLYTNHFSTFISGTGRATQLSAVF